MVINMAKRYTAEFKQKAVELYRASNTSYAAIAKELGIDQGSLSAWVKKADGDNAPGGKNAFQMEEELRKLKAENTRLKTENEILLKASAFFASKQM